MCGGVGGGGYCAFYFDKIVSIIHLISCLGGFLLGRTISVLFTMTLGTSMAARQGPVAMAAHQICLQVWLAVSLLTDALAASAQVKCNSLCALSYSN